MPFWEQVQRCQNCRFWQQDDPSHEFGHCAVESSIKLPEWADPRTHATRWDDGTRCLLYRHQAVKPHPLDTAAAFLALVEKGDRIPMRTYGIGTISYATAQVTHRNTMLVTVRMLNAVYRVRLKATADHHAGTVLELPDWGVDVAGLIEPGPVTGQYPQRAQSMLRDLKPGDTLPLIGLPPLTDKHRIGHVVLVTDKYVTVQVGRGRKVKMHASGPLAGIIEGELWTLDTSRGSAP